MPPIQPLPPGKPAPDAILLADRLAFKVVGSLHKLFGFSYSRNTEHFTNQITLDTTLSWALGEQILGSLRISQEADFICTRLNAETRWLVNADTSDAGGLYLNTATGISQVVTEPAGAQDIPFDIEITDGGTDRVLQNEPITARALLGMVGGLPGIWSKPRMFARNSNVSVRITMLRGSSAVSSLRTKILFMGWKIYDAEALDLTARRP